MRPSACVLHPVPLRLVRLTLWAAPRANALPNGTAPGRRTGNDRGPYPGPGYRKPPPARIPARRSPGVAGIRQPVSSSASARSARRYEPIPKPATVPLATAATTEVCRNSSRLYGLEICTSISGAVRCAAASRMPYE